MDESKNAPEETGAVSTPPTTSSRSNKIQKNEKFKKNEKMLVNALKKIRKTKKKRCTRNVQKKTSGKRSKISNKPKHAHFQNNGHFSLSEINVLGANNDTDIEEKRKQVCGASGSARPAEVSATLPRSQSLPILQPDDDDESSERDSLFSSFSNYTVGDYTCCPNSGWSDSDSEDYIIYEYQEELLEGMNKLNNPTSEKETMKRKLEHDDGATSSPSDREIAEDPREKKTKTESMSNTSFEMKETPQIIDEQKTGTEMEQRHIDFAHDIEYITVKLMMLSLYDRHMDIE